MNSALEFAVRALTIISAAADVGMEIADLIRLLRFRVETMQKEKRDPTADEWRELNDKIAELRARLQTKVEESPAK